MIEQNPSYTEQNIQSAQSVFGNDPSAVKRGVAQTMMQSPTFQAPIQGQANALDALSQIKAYDQQLAQQVSQGNQQQLANQQAQRQDLTAYGSTGPTAQATIQKAQQAIPELQTRQPTIGFLSPFVADSLATGASRSASDTYDIAGQTRASLTKAIGSEAQSYADAIANQNARDEAVAQRELEMVKLLGGSWTDPVTNKTYTFPKPGEGGETGILSKTSKSGKTFLDEVTDGQGSFIDIINQNPQLTDSEILDLARANVNKFGQFQESADELRQMGLGIIADAGLSAGSGVSPEVQGYVDLVKSGDLTIAGVPADIRNQVVTAISSSGGIDQVDPEKAKSQSDYDAISKELDNLAKLAEEQNILGVFSPTQKAEYETLRKALAQAIGNLMEGGKLSDKDYEKYLDLMPTRYGWQPAKEKQVESLKRAVGLKLGINTDSNAEEQALRDAGYSEEEIKLFMEE